MILVNYISLSIYSVIDPCCSPDDESLYVLCRLRGYDMSHQPVCIEETSTRSTNEDSDHDLENASPQRRSDSKDIDPGSTPASEKR
jgi:hypothetical protein